MGVVFADERTIDRIVNEPGEDVSCRLRKRDSRSGFSQSSANFEAFRSHRKVSPLILPDGRVTAFADAGYLGVITASDGSKRDAFCWSLEKSLPDGATFTASYFEKSNQGDCFEDKHGCQIFPIPLAAASGPDPWFGAATGIYSATSFADLKNALGAVETEPGQTDRAVFREPDLPTWGENRRVDAGRNPGLVAKKSNRPLHRDRATTRTTWRCLTIGSEYTLR